MNIPGLNVPVPKLIMQVAKVINPVEGPVAVIVHVPVSKALKPLPVTVTGAPLGPLGGDSEIETALTGTWMDEKITMKAVIRSSNTNAGLALRLFNCPNIPLEIPTN